jgi:glycosyltransferase involved in cell wall biosynthesis
VQNLRILEIHQIHGNIGSATGFEAVSHGLRERGFQVFQFALDPNVTIKTDDTYFIRFHKRNAFQQVFSPKIALALFSTIKKVRPDIIHIHAIDASLLGFGLPILYGKLLGAKIVKTQHDWGIICTNAWHIREKGACDQTIGLHCSGCYTNKVFFFRDFLGKKLLRNPLFHLLVDVYTVPSHALQEDMQTLGYRNVYLIPNFLDKPIGRKTGRPLPGNTVIFIGRFVKEKGIDQLIACMALVKKEVPDSELTIIGMGSPEETAHLSELIDGIHGREFIHVFKGISDEEKTKLLQGSKVCIVPSIWKENFPLVVLEAFASGVPVVAYKIGGLPEILQDERVVVEWNNVQELARKTIQLLRDEDLRSIIIQKNDLRLQDFDKEKIIHQWSDLFDSLKSGEI